MILLASVVGLSLVITDDLFSQRRGKGRRRMSKPPHSEMGVDVPRGGGRGKPHHSEYGVETPRGHGRKMAGMSAKDRKKFRDKRRKSKEALKKIFDKALKKNSGTGIAKAEIDFQKWPMWFMAVNTLIRAYKEKKPNVAKALIKKGLDVKEFGRGKRGRSRGMGKRRGMGRGHGKWRGKERKRMAQQAESEDKDDGIAILRQSPSEGIAYSGEKSDHDDHKDSLYN